MQACMAGRTQGKQFEGGWYNLQRFHSRGTSSPQVKAAGIGLKGAFSRWNSRTEYSSALIAARILFSPQENSFSFTISSSRTNRSDVKHASPSEWRCSEPLPDIARSKSKPKPPVHSAAKRQPYRSNPRRDGRSFVANVSRNDDTLPARRSEGLCSAGEG